MRLRPFATTLFLWSILLLPSVAWSSTITAHYQNLGFVTSTPGQSVTTPGGGPWDNLLFNWFINAGPTASGTLFLLTQEYLGTPAGLSAATPGFVASTATISAGVWSFAPGVTVQSNTQYFFYSNQALQISGGLNLYAGGILYWTVGSPTFVGQNTDDFDFLLQGTPTAAAVPEPGTFVLLGLGIVGAAARRRMQAPIARLPL